MTQATPGSTGQPAEFREQIRVQGEQLVEKVRELLHEGNVRHIIIKHEDHTVMEIPVTLGVVAAVLAPMLAAVGAVGAALTHCTVEVVRMEPPPTSGTPPVTPEI
ncbi:MAG TPA: DUF4342 domain-containing protein [Chthonomonadaceae bacterium]|nr:DUF4342 domain-containing protein [Chthonomonadaceae bacterium]